MEEKYDKYDFSKLIEEIEYVSKEIYSKMKEEHTKVQQYPHINTAYIYSYMRANRLKIFELEKKIFLRNESNKFEESNDEWSNDEINNELRKNVKNKLLQSLYSKVSLIYDWLHVNDSLELVKALRDKIDAQVDVHNLQNIFGKKTSQMRDIVTKVKYFFTENKKKISTLCHQKKLHADRILELERQLRQHNFTYMKIIELETIVMNLKNYVNVDFKQQPWKSEKIESDEEISESKKILEFRSTFKDNQSAKNISKKSDLFNNIAKEKMKKKEMQEMIYIIPRKNNTSIQEEIIQQQDQFVKIVYEQIIEQQNQLETKLKIKKQEIKNMEYKIRHKNKIIQKLEHHIFKQQNKIQEMTKMITKLKKSSHAHYMDIKSNKKTRKLKTKNENEGFLKDSHMIDKLTIIPNKKQNIEFGLKSYDIERQLQEIVLEFLKKEKLILDICLKYKRQNNQKIIKKRIIYNIKCLKRYLPHEEYNIKNSIRLKQRKNALLRHLYRQIVIEANLFKKKSLLSQKDLSSAKTIAKEINKKNRRLTDKRKKEMQETIEFNSDRHRMSQTFEKELDRNYHSKNTSKMDYNSDESLEYLSQSRKRTKLE